MVSLLKVKHEVLMFDRYEVSCNKHGLVGIYVFSTKALAEVGKAKLWAKIPHRLFLVREAL
jgi:hypothetical protein